MFYGKVLVYENTGLAPGYYRLTVLAPEIAADAKPGQFVQLRASGSDCNDPLLARPISIFQIDTTAATVSLIYKVVGRGTSMMAGLKAGLSIEMLGPVGNGFTLPGQARNVALIAGGVGMPPLFCFAEYIKRNHTGCKVNFFYGARSEGDLLAMDLWSEAGAEVFVATEDGSKGRRGLITELFQAEHRSRPFDFLASCGPQPMLQAVQQIALTEGIDGQISLEARMACGVGACLGCACKTRQGFRRVCVDGPVFPVQEVVWR